MKMLVLLALAAALPGSRPALAQLATAPRQPHPVANPNRAAVRQVITDFFDGMRRGDSAAVRRTLAPGAVLHSVNTRTGPAQLQPESIPDFLRQVGTPHPEVYDEQITFERMLFDADLASVWTPYRFYVGGSFSHCGCNSFQLVHLAAGWRIAYLIDTRRKVPCWTATKP